MLSEKKIFGLGFHKTGTQSLASALQILGYKIAHGDPHKVRDGGTEGKIMIEQYIKRGDYKLPVFEMYDAFLDNPYFSIWKELVKMFPDAKYILTIRDEKAWIKSCVRYYEGRGRRPMREWMFGEYADPSKNIKSREVWRDAYRRHNEEIMNYFASAGTKLLLMDIEKGDDWNVLCPFLDKKIPSIPFPHKNKSKKSMYIRVASFMPAILRKHIKSFTPPFLLNTIKKY